MKYLLINQQTGEQTLCDKVTIDGFDYYASKVEIILNDPITNGYAVWLWKDDCSLLGRKKVIATNNPNIYIPQVVDEVERLKFIYNEGANKDVFTTGVLTGIEIGYNKSQETHPFNEEDIVEFNEWCNKNYEFDNRCNQWFYGNGYWTTKELLQLWKEQQPKTVYYEK